MEILSDMKNDGIFRTNIFFDGYFQQCPTPWTPTMSEVLSQLPREKITAASPFWLG